MYIPESKMNSEYIEKCRLNQKLFNERALLECCPCGLKYENICRCDNPIFELVRINQQLFCRRCNNWRDRCLKN